MENPVPKDNSLALINKSIDGWRKETRNALAYKIAMLGLKDRSEQRQSYTRIHWHWNTKGQDYFKREEPLQPSVKTSTAKKMGEIERVRISFARHGIFLEHGVGKGRARGSGKERPRPWLAPTMMVQIPLLANELAKHQADRVASQLKFLVPGIIEIKIDVK